MNPNCYTHKAYTVRTFSLQGRNLFPLEGLLPICIYSSIIPVVAVLQSYGQISITLFAHTTFSKHTGPFSTTDGCFFSAKWCVLIRKQVDIISEVWWQDASKTWAWLIKTLSGIVNFLTGCDFRSNFHFIINELVLWWETSVLVPMNDHWQPVGRVDRQCRFWQEIHSKMPCENEPVYCMSLSDHHLPYPWIAGKCVLQECVCVSV